MPHMAWDGVKNEDFTKLGGNIFHSIHHISFKREGFSLGEYRMIPVQIKPFFPALDTRGEIGSPHRRINSVLPRIEQNFLRSFTISGRIRNTFQTFSVDFRFCSIDPHRKCIPVLLFLPLSIHQNRERKSFFRLSTNPFHPTPQRRNVHITRYGGEDPHPGTYPAKKQEGIQGVRFSTCITADQYG